MSEIDRHLEPSPGWNEMSWQERYDDEVRRHGESLKVAREAIEAATRSQSERVSRLEEALRKYGGHKPACRMQVRIGEPCSCGWNAARSALNQGADDGR